MHIEYRHTKLCYFICVISNNLIFVIHNGEYTQANMIHFLVVNHVCLRDQQFWKNFICVLWQSMVLKHPMQFWIYVLWSSCELPEAQVSSCFMSYAFHFVFMVNLLYMECLWAQWWPRPQFAHDMRTQGKHDLTFS